MDFFYKPPIERPDECEVLERNYMNCMLQKALKDRVFTNRCNMESILWFHLECPKAKDKFDDPVEFKIKWRDFFSQVHAGAKAVLDPDNEEVKRVRNEFDAHLYPEDIKIRPEAHSFLMEKAALTPVVTPAESNEIELEEGPESHLRTYKPERFKDAAPISVADSKKFGGDQFGKL